MRNYAKHSELPKLVILGDHVCSEASRDRRIVITLCTWLVLLVALVELSEKLLKVPELS